MSSRPDLPRSWKIATVWLLVGVALFLGIQAWQAHQVQTRFSVTTSGVIEIRRSADGHYHWPGTVQGEPVDFLIDTGATGTVLPADLVAGWNLPVLGEVVSQTANGIARGDLVRVDVQLQGGVRIDDLRVAVLPGLSGKPLLGMDVMGHLRWQQEAGVLRIQAAR
jgi:aspartyl protease family protein